jgi:hypothetical protein
MIFGGSWSRPGTGEGMKRKNFAIWLAMMKFEC